MPLSQNEFATQTGIIAYITILYSDSLQACPWHYLRHLATWHCKQKAHSHMYMASQHLSALLVLAKSTHNFFHR